MAVQSHLVWWLLGTGTHRGWCSLRLLTNEGGLQLAPVLVCGTQSPVLGGPWYLPGPTPLRQPGEGEWASLDLGMWAGQSGAGWPGVGQVQTELGSWAADSRATQGRDLGFCLLSRMAPVPSLASIEQMEKLSWGQGRVGRMVWGCLL